MIFVDKSEYLRILQDFVSGLLSFSDFEAELLSLWQKDRDKERQITESWDRRYDLDLQRELQNGNISREEYFAKSDDLWGNDGEKDREFATILSSVFVNVDIFCPDEELRDENDMDEQDLRREFENTLEQLRQTMQAN